MEFVVHMSLIFKLLFPLSVSIFCCCAVSTRSTVVCDMPDVVRVVLGNVNISSIELLHVEVRRDSVSSFLLTDTTFHSLHRGKLFCILT